jgi:hypothetical protein
LGHHGLPLKRVGATLLFDPLPSCGGGGWFSPPPPEKNHCYEISREKRGAHRVGQDTQG